MNMEVVTFDRDHHSEASVKVSSRCNSRNPVKTPPVLQVSPWSLGGCGGSWWTWRWCHMIGIIIQKLLWKFHQDATAENLSRLHLSSKSLPGVLGDIEVPDELGGGVMCQDSTCPTSLSLESTKIPVPRMKYHHWSLILQN